MLPASAPPVRSRRPRRGWRCLLLLLGLVGAPLAAQPSREYDLKAVFLFNFVTFVEWPQAARPDKGPFIIGVLGQDPFGAALDEVIAGEKFRQAPLQARRCRTLEEAGQCHILFISASEAARLPAIMKELRNRPVLTVSDLPQFLEAGGIIAFSTDARIQLHINPPAAQHAGLTISSKLLRVAKVVEAKAAP
jgi:hypothetical protein